MTKFFTVTGVILAVLAAGLVYLASTANNYATPDQLSLSVLEEPVTIRRDETGVPYIFAQSEADLIRAQGFVTAQDRLFQMELYRRIINGRLSEVVGSAGVQSDIRARVLNISGNARRHAQQLAPEVRAYLQNYADGVNAYLECCSNDFPLELSLMKLEPAPWTVEDVMTVMHFVGMTHGRNMEDELLVVRLVAALGPERAGALLPLNRNLERNEPFFEIAPDGLASVSGLVGPVRESRVPELFPGFGSNNWAVGPTRTASGQALLANDPHVDPRILPGPWLPIGMQTPDIKAFGVAIPGLPGFVVGRTEHVAWGVTNGYGDSQDLYFETTAPGDPAAYLDEGVAIPFETRTETLRVKDDNAKGGFSEREITIRSTTRGPVITDHPGFAAPEGVDLSLKWSLALSQRGQIGIDRFLTAGNADELETAIADVDIMFFNYIFADRAGAIGRRSSGRVPIRASSQGAYPQIVSDLTDWTGWIPKKDMPGSRGEDAGWVATANNDFREDDYPYFYSSHFAPVYRYQRIGELLSGTKETTLVENWQFILDDLNLQAGLLAPKFAAVLENEAALARHADMLRGWDYRDDKTSSAATFYHVLYELLFGEVFDDELGDELSRTVQQHRYFWLERLDRMLIDGESDWFDDLTTEGTVETFDDLVLRAARKADEFLTRELGPDPDSWEWGKLHTITFVSPLRQSGLGSEFLGYAPIPVSGSGETVQRGQYPGRTDFGSTWVDSVRFVTDFANDEYVYGVIAGGVTARQGHPYFKNQVPVWAAGDHQKWWLDPELAKQNTDMFIRLTAE